MTASEFEKIKSLIRRPKEGWSAYDAGYDCGLNGAAERNCHFSFFGSPASTKEWERGKADGERARVTPTTPQPEKGER